MEPRPYDGGRACLDWPLLRCQTPVFPGEHIVHERALARPAHPGHAGQRAQRNAATSIALRLCSEALRIVIQPDTNSIGFPGRFDRWRCRPR